MNKSNSSKAFMEHKKNLRKACPSKPDNNIYDIYSNERNRLISSGGTSDETNKTLSKAEKEAVESAIIKGLDKLFKK